VNTYLSLPLIQTIFCLALTAIVLKGHFRSFVHRLFSVFILWLAVWGIVIFGMRASPDTAHAYVWDKLLIPLAPLIPVTFYHFSVCYTGAIIKRWVLPSVYGICLLFIPLATTDLVISGMRMAPFGYAPIFGPAASVWVFFTYGMFVMALLNFIRAYKISAYAEQRNRAAYIIMGIGVFFIGATFDILPALGLPLYPSLIICNIVFCLTTTVAILRHSLLDIRIVFRKSATYVLTSALLAAPFVGIFLLATRVLTGVSFSWWVYILLLVVLALILPQLWQAIQRRVDRWFYRDRYNYLKALETFSWETQSITDSVKLCSSLVNLIAGALRTSYVYLLQPLGPGDNFVMSYSAGVNNNTPSIILGSESVLVKWLRRSDKILPYQDLAFVPQLQHILPKEREKLEEIGVQLIVPLRTQRGQLSGLLILGHKLSDQPYCIEDMQLINAIRSQMAIHLENVRLYTDAVRARENLETWLNSMSDCVMIVNTDFSIQFVNKAGVERFGAGAGEKCWSALGKDTMCPECSIPHYLRGSTDGLRYGRNIQDREYDIAVAPLLNADGSLSVVEVLRDVTEGKRAQEEIVRLMKTIETAREAINVTSADGTLIYTNPAMDELFGYERGELIGKYPSIFNAGPTPEAVTKKIMAAVEKEGYREGEIRSVRKDGTEFISYARISALVDKDGKITNFLSTQHDITERKRAEMALRESEEFNSSLLTNSPNPILVLNADTSIKYVNPALEKLTGFSSLELIGRKPLYPWWIEETSEELSSRLKKSMRWGARKYEQLFKKKNGERFWVEVSFKTVKVNGESKYHLSNWVDLTEQKRLRENMEFYISEITRVQEEERKRIAREIHDEWVQSLAALALESDSIATQKKNLPKDIIQRLEGLRDATKNILDGLRRFSHELRPGVIDQGGLVSVLEILTEEMNKERVDTSLEIVGSERRLKPEIELVLFRIAQEALRNVRRHSGATKAAIRLRFTRAKVRLTLSDNGSGFKPPERLGDFAAKSKLGLIGMQERARLLNGKFLVKSHIGKGTTVIVEADATD